MRGISKRRCSVCPWQTSLFSVTTAEPNQAVAQRRKIKATKEKDKDEKAKDHCGGLEKHSLSSGHGREQGNEKL